VSAALTQRLRRREVSIGTVHSIRDEFVSELIGRASFDFVVIDQQHAPVDVETLQRLLVGLFPAQSAVLVRPPHNDYTAIGQALDLGASGVIVPMVNSPDDARRAVAACRYPPEGMRSWGPRRAMRISGGRDEYARTAGDNVLVLPQIETREAVAELDAILAVPGISGVVIGPADLAASLGFLRDRSNPAVDSAFVAVLERCRQFGVPFGMFTNTIADAETWIERGATLVVCGGDVDFVAEGLERVLSAVRDAVGISHVGG
jgi:2-keto-3-deoxy-L-rhamnonate aldolase RhmA